MKKLKIRDEDTKECGSEIEQTIEISVRVDRYCNLGRISICDVGMKGDNQVLRGLAQNKELLELSEVFEKINVENNNTLSSLCKGKEEGTWSKRIFTKTLTLSETMPNRKSSVLSSIRAWAKNVKVDQTKYAKPIKPGEINPLIQCLKKISDTKKTSQNCDDNNEIEMNSMPLSPK